MARTPVCLSRELGMSALVASYLDAKRAIDANSAGKACLVLGDGTISYSALLSFLTAFCYLVSCL